MAKPTLKAVLLSPQRPLGEHPLLVVGSVPGHLLHPLEQRPRPCSAPTIDVVAWDLPGHGVSPAATETFDVAALADAVVDLVDSIAPGENFHYAGVSLGGAVGLQLGIKHGDTAEKPVRPEQRRQDRHARRLAGTRRNRPRPRALR